MINFKAGVGSTCNRGIKMKRILIAAAFIAVAATCTLPANAANIIDEWSSVKTPPPPALKQVALDPKTTALLMLDFVKPICNEKEGARCVASLPMVKRLLDKARASGMTVIYTSIPHVSKDAIRAEVAPKGDEPFIQSFLDKFLRSDLEKILRDKGIKTIVAVGTVAEGAIISTASQAAQRGFKVVVPVDGMSAESAYAEQYVAWDLANAPVISGQITLTKVDMIKF